MADPRGLFEQLQQVRNNQGRGSSDLDRAKLVNDASLGDKAAALQKPDLGQEADIAGKIEAAPVGASLPQNSKLAQHLAEAAAQAAQCKAQGGGCGTPGCPNCDQSLDVK